MYVLGRINHSYSLERALQAILPNWGHRLHHVVINRSNNYHKCTEIDLLQVGKIQSIQMLHAQSRTKHIHIQNVSVNSMADSFLSWCTIEHLSR